MIIASIIEPYVIDEEGQLINAITAAGIVTTTYSYPSSLNLDNIVTLSVTGHTTRYTYNYSTIYHRPYQISVKWSTSKSGVTVSKIFADFVVGGYKYQINTSSGTVTQMSHVTQHVSITKSNPSSGTLYTSTSGALAAGYGILVRTYNTDQMYIQVQLSYTYGGSSYTQTQSVNLFYQVHL